MDLHACRARIVSDVLACARGGGDLVQLGELGADPLHDRVGFGLLLAEHYRRSGDVRIELFGWWESR
jgi:hypothetical protein